jgi:hypothetical protein
MEVEMPASVGRACVGFFQESNTAEVSHTTSIRSVYYTEVVDMGNINVTGNVDLGKIRYVMIYSSISARSARRYFI